MKATGITGIQIRNFKSLASVNLRLKNLNYLLGENSLGKSSVGQAMLMLAENLRDSDLSSFKLNGKVVKLGSDNQVRRAGAESIEIGFDVEQGNQNSVDSSSDSKIFKSSLLLNVLYRYNQNRPVNMVSFADSRARLSFSMSSVHECVINGHSIGPGIRGDFSKLNLTKSALPYESGNLPSGNFALSKPAVNREKLQEAFDRVWLTWRDKQPWIGDPENIVIVPIGLTEALGIAALLDKGDFDNLEDDLSNLVDVFVDYFNEPFQVEESVLFEWANTNNVFQGFWINNFLHNYLTPEGDSQEDPDATEEEKEAHEREWEQYYARRAEWNRTVHFVFSGDAPSRNSANEAIDFLASKMTGFSLLSRIRFGSDSRPWEGGRWESLTAPGASNWEQLTKLNQRVVATAQAITSGLHYLGPLRGDGYASQRNDLVSDSLIPVGHSGEMTAQALLAEYPDFESRVIQLQRKQAEPNSTGKYPFPSGLYSDNLQEAMDEWLSFFELGSNLVVKNLGVSGYEFTLDGVNLYHLGTGVSQIIPVLAICLLAKPGSLTIIEQPELHLHPAAQQKLADFFLAISRTGRRLLIETHSEYMITRTRRAVVLSKAKPSEIQLFFAERGKDSTTIRPANLNGSGGFKYWPKGFFSQTEDDLLDILKALDS